MDSKTLHVLEYHKILEHLSDFCDFSASKALALALQPTSSFNEARRLLAETSEACYLLSTRDLTIGGSHDIRDSVELATRGGVLEPQALLDIKSTLIACRDLKKSLEHAAAEAPRLSEIATGLPETYGLVDAISRVISDRGDVLDTASPRLASIRRELKISHDRLMSKLQKYLTDSKTVSMLQEAIITQRDGRYVIPLRAEFKGRIKAVVHDQSSSGATLFIEPLAVVELNNQLRELELAERDEERRVLTELCAQVSEYASDLIYGIENLAVLDLTFAKAKYAEEIKASEPILHEMTEDRRQKTVKRQSNSVDGQPPALPAPVPQAQVSEVEGSSIACRLLQARHPLLDPSTVVPITVDLEPGIRALVITGPNTGGKTVSLKTVGLLVLMAQSGLHIPASSGSELPCFEAVWADIGDEQSIEQSLSTFSGHLTNIVHILEKADRHSLVILDELGAGTDPQEGAALARAILAHLLERGITTLVATHYPELKTYAHATEGIVNASLEFDIKTLRPTYKLTIGLPGRSNALAIATRLGLDPEIIGAAKNEINPENLRADKLLDDIRKERNRAGREREKTAKARKQTENLNRELQARLAVIEDERRDVIAKARAEVELEVAVLKRNLASLKTQLKQARQPLDALKHLEEQVENVEAKAEAPVERRPTTDHKRPSSVVGRPLSLGEKVVVPALNAEGVVTALGESEAEVQVGTLRIRAKLSELVRKSQIQEPDDDSKLKVESPDSIGNATAGRSTFNARRSPGLELDLRGQASDDALDILERYLDQAYSAGLPYVRIIHGKGTGKLRQVVRDALRQNAHVSSFEEGGPKEGGEGVTVAKIDS
jgi:DNA mismatch repair protein MutS2